MTDSPDTPSKSNLTLQATFARGQAKPKREDLGGGSDPGKQTSLGDMFSWPGRIILLLALVWAPWAFGAYEYWAQRWLALSLLAGLAFWWFETAMNNRKTQVFPYLFFPVAAGLLIGFVQLFGLPEPIANLLLERQIDIFDRFTERGEASASISVDPDGTWRQIRLLVIAIGALLLGCRFFRSRRDIVLLLTTMSLNGAVISFYGIVQRLTGENNIFWPVEIEVTRQLYGPFVNRNNAAGYLLICLACAIGLLPILMAERKNTGPQNLISKEIPFWRQINYHLIEFIAELTAKKVALLLLIVLLTSGVIASLSRGGVLALLIGGAATIMLYGMARKPKNATFIFVPLIAIIALLTGWLSFGDQLMERFERVDLVNTSDSDVRMQHWQSTWPATSDFGPLGAGLGSYQGVHRLYRSDPESVVFHYAENNYYQSLIEAGWPGLLLFLSAWTLAYLCARFTLNRGSSPTTIAIGTMGMFLIFSQMTASFFDFGLYAPSNMFAVAVLFGFVSYHAQSLGDRLKEKTWIQFQLPNYAIQIAVLILFGGTCIVALDLHQRAGIEALLRPRENGLNPDSMPAKETEDRLADLMPRVLATPSPDGLNHLAALWIHRGRLARLQTVQSQLGIDNLEGKSLELVWDATDLQAMHDEIHALSADRKYGAVSFRRQEAIRENLPRAQQLLAQSRNLSPLQPVVHLRLAQVSAVVGPTEAGHASMERAIELAPANPNFRLVAGIYYLESNEPELAAPHLRKLLELEPGRFRRVLELLTARTNRSIEPEDPTYIVEQVIPDDPTMLFAMASEFFPARSQQQSEILNRAAELIVNAEQRIQEHVILLGDIRQIQGNREEAIDLYSSALLSQPSDRNTRFKRAKLYRELGELEKALDDAEYIDTHGRANRNYQQFLREVKRSIRDREREGR